MFKIFDIINNGTYLIIDLRDKINDKVDVIVINMDGYGVNHTIEEATYKLKYDFNINITSEEIEKIKKLYYNCFYC